MSKSGIDYSTQIFESLPENAKQYFHARSEERIEDLCYTLNFQQKLWRNLNLLRLYPLLSITYLNSNEMVCVVVDGEHRIYRGPGFQWVVGITDELVRKYVVGEDIDFGPTKIIYVQPGTLKFAQMRNTGRPLLLGPGMHYFNDINLFLGSEISMNFHGDNQVLKCDPIGAFQFVFVKVGSEAIITNRDGSLRIVGPGLHFIQAPDSLKTFVSVQQEHLRFGTILNGQRFMTADNIELNITASLFYRITDVCTMFTSRIKDINDLQETLLSQAVATLLTIIRSENFQGIGKKGQTTAMNRDAKDGMQNTPVYGFDETDDHPIPATAVVATPMNALSKGTEALATLTMGFQNIIQDAEPQFRRLMDANFGRSGIEIQSLRIEQIEFADPIMQKHVAEFATTNTKLLSQQQAIQVQRAVQVAEAERDAAAKLIKSRAEADMKLLMTDADNEIRIKTAKSEAENSRIRTEADARNKTILAQAEADAKLKIGEAELAIMERQNAMPNAQLRILTEAQKSVLQGVTKVIYTDQQSMLLKPYLAMPDNTV